MGLVWLLIGLDSRLHFFPVKRGFFFFFFFFTLQTNLFWSFAVLFMSLCQQPKDFQQSIVVGIRIGSPSALCESRGRQICASNINTSDPDHSSQERPDSCYEIGWQRLWWVFASETAQRNLKLTQFADGLLSKAIDFLCVSVTHLPRMIVSVGVCVCPVKKIKELLCQNSENPVHGREKVSVDVMDTPLCVLWGDTQEDELPAFTSGWVSTQWHEWEEMSECERILCIERKG